MNVSEGRGNEGSLGLLEVVWNDLGDEAAQAANWGGEFDGIRSDEDFRRALAIKGVTIKSVAVTPMPAPAPVPTLASVEVSAPASILVRTAKAVRAMGEALSAWRAIRLPMR